MSSNIVEEILYTILMMIPIGKVTTYSALAKLLGIHPRRVARILAKNRNPIIIPCHRVVMSNGEIGGYSLGKDLKKKLLLLEGVVFDDRDRIRRDLIVEDIEKEVFDT